MSEEIKPATPASPAAAPTPISTPHPTHDVISAITSGGPLFVTKIKEHLLSLWEEFAALKNKYEPTIPTELKNAAGQVVATVDRSAGEAVSEIEKL